MINLRVPQMNTHSINNFYVENYITQMLNFDLFFKYYINHLKHYVYNI